MKTFRRVATWALVSGVVALFLVPLVVPVESSGTETYLEAAGPNAQFTEIEGVAVHYEVEKYTGDCECQAPLLVLLHGFGASSFSWQRVMAPLSNFGEVVAYDRPAFGFTERPIEWKSTNPYSLAAQMKILSGVVNQFGQGRKVVLIGHSAGGQIAAEFAREQPQLVNSLILVDPAILSSGGIPEGLVWLLDIPQVDRVGPLLVGQISSSGDAVIRKSWFDESKITPNDFNGYRAPLKIRGWEQAFWQFVKAPKATDLSDHLGQIPQNTLVISGDNDKIVPAEDAIRLAGLLHRSELEIIENTGHLPQEESPEGFIRAISKHANFLALG